MRKDFITPEYVTGEYIKNVRKQLKLTQKEFAKLVNTSLPTVERWESSSKKITGPIVLLILLLAKDNKIAEDLLIPEQKYSVRMWYMHEDNICTLIEIEERSREIYIKNYTDKMMFKAFGRIEKPTYEQFEEWLESRCFPRERDKMKLMLQELDIPFYDPMLIVEKTQGRMAEDNFWIKMEQK